MTDASRVYCDANLPAGLVRFMRERLKWDVCFVVEDDRLRRAPDIRHFHLAAQLRRTLLTLDRDYLDDVCFPLTECGGVIVLSAPDHEQFERLLRRVDCVLFQGTTDKEISADAARMPLLGRKLHVHTDGTGELVPRDASSARGSLEQL
ncbi:MAG: hypothetical protein EXQ55_08890 [Acidobacteria bacterium]|nr:hypothetical protein [Acidobacteriota bacterium]